MPDVVQRADIRMRELRDRPCLALEAAAKIGVFRQMRRQNLDRDDAIESDVAGAIHVAHPARTHARL